MAGNAPRRRSRRLVAAEVARESAAAQDSAEANPQENVVKEEHKEEHKKAGEAKAQQTESAQSSSSSMPALQERFLRKHHRVPYAALGTPVPDTLAFFSGEPMSLPEGWADRRGGDFAARYSDMCKRALNGRSKGREVLESEYRLYFEAFRRVGFVDMTIKGSKSALDRLAYTPGNKGGLVRVQDLREKESKATFRQVLWREDTGEPAAVETPVSMARLRKAVYENKVSITHNDAEDSVGPDELLAWIDMVTTYQHPQVSPWRTPFVRCVAQVEKVGSSQMRARIHLYVGRLLFFMIADEGLRALLKLPRPSAGICGPISRLAPAEPVFRRSCEGATAMDRFTAAALLRAHESVGYAQREASPPGLALEMRDYQLQTLQWMIDQERLPRGLNGCFWEERRWVSNGEDGGGGGNAGANSFFFSSELGELRLEAPPLVRGGLVCEEMGLGKTLEFIALVLHDRVQPEADFAAVDKLCASNASLFVVPDALLPQWAQELEKCLQNPDALRIATLESVRERAGDLASLRLHRQGANEAKPSSASDTNDVSSPSLPSPQVLSKSTSSQGRDSGADLPASGEEGFEGINVSAHASQKVVQAAARQLAACDIVLTTYRDVERCSKVIRSVHWRRVCLDEMQEIRSSTTHLARTCQGITARARWMISGTPVYTGIDDIHGELNFLGIIPFSLPDTQDGFWGRCIKAPFDKRQQASLGRLGLLLDHVMMRHSKQQTYVAAPTKTILELPAASVRFVGVPLERTERALYRYIEVLVTRAVELMGDRSGLIAARRFGQVYGRPWSVGAELLRSFASSPQLVNGGNGAAPQLVNLNSFVRNLMQTLRTQASSASKAIPAMFSGFSALPSDELRDYLLSAEAAATSSSTSSSSFSSSSAAAFAGTFRNNGVNRQQYAATAGAGAGAAAGAVREHILERLNETREKLTAAQKDTKEALCSAKGGTLPKLRWRWAVQAITSGKYLALLWLQNRSKPTARQDLISYVQNRARSGILMRRAARVVWCVTRLETAQAQVDAEWRRYELKTSEQLCRELASLSSDFSYEVTLEENTSLWDAGAMTERTTLKLHFPGRDAPIKLSDDPVGLRGRIVKSILSLHHGFRCLKRITKVLQADFDEQCSPGIALPLPVLPVALSLRGARFEARFIADGKRAFYETRALLAVDEKAGAVKVSFLDGEERLVAVHDVRYVPHYAVANGPTGGAEKSGKDAAAQEAGTIETTTEKPGEAGSGDAANTAPATLMDVCKRAGLNRESLARIAEKEDLARMSLLQIHKVNVPELRNLMVDNDQEALADRRLDRFWAATHGAVVRILFENTLARDAGLRDRIREWYGAESSRDVAGLADLVGETMSKDEKEALRVALREHFADGAEKLELSYASFSVRFGLKGPGFSSAAVAGDFDENAQPAFGLVDSGMQTGPRLLARVAPMSPSRTSNRASELMVAKVLAVDNASHSARVELEDGTVLGIPWTEFAVQDGSTGPSTSTTFAPSAGKQASKRPQKRKERDADEDDDDEDDDALEDDAEDGVRKRRRTAANVRNGHRLAFETTKGGTIIYADEILATDYEQGQVTVRRADNGLPETFDWAHMRLDKEWSGAAENVHESVSEKFARIAVLKSSIADKSKLAQDLQTYANTLQAAYERGASRVETLERQGLLALQELIDKTNVPECGICLDKLEDPTCTVCIHLFCESCMHQHIKASANMNSGMASRNEPVRFACPLCRRRLAHGEVFRVLEPTSAADAMGLVAQSRADDAEVAQEDDDGASSSKGKKKKENAQPQDTRKVTRSMRRQAEAKADGAMDVEGENAEVDDDEEEEEAPPEAGPDEVVESTGNASAARWSACADTEETSNEMSRCAMAVPGLSAPTQRAGLEALSTNFIKLLGHVTGMHTPAAAQDTCKTKRGSKVGRVVEDLKRFATQEGKTVVFSQQRQAVVHLSTILQQEDVVHARIIKGDRVPVLRTALEAFLKDDNVRVLLLQSSSAAAGLTLTVANRVLLFEPFLKHGEELQAINRVHRIGQTKPVEAICYFSRGTVEERVLAWRVERERANMNDPRNEHGLDDLDEMAPPDVGNRFQQHKALESRRYLRFITGLSNAVNDDEEQDEVERLEDADHASDDDSSQEDEDEANEDEDLLDLDSDESDNQYEPLVVGPDGYWV